MAVNEIFEILEFREFLKRIKKEVSKEVGEEYKVSIHHVTKNNSVELDSLIILKNNETVTPNIYLNPFYERFLKGEKLQHIVEEILHIYRESQAKEKEKYSVSYTFPEMKPFIIYHLVNYSKNKKLLKGIPHVRFLDLAVTFHCLVRNNEEGIGTIRIMNEHLKDWNISVEELKEAAKVNTPRIFPHVIKGMNEIILEIIESEINDKESITSKTSEEILKSMKDGMDSGKANTMYVLSNTKGVNGAGCLIYPEVIENLAKKWESDFYILPSSIHEIILIRGNGLLEKEELKRMVMDVNQSQVPREDILSDSVYFYSRERNAITVLH